MPIVQNSPHALQPGTASKDAACLIVRVVAGLSMILYNSWLMVHQGWEHLWRKGEWTLLNVVNDLGLPMPLVVACVIASIFFFGSIFLMLGVFGRVTSALLLVTTEIGCYFALRAGAIAYVELSLLYGALYILHLLLGSGRVSLDQVLAGMGRKRIRKRNPAEF
jgi:uncharacterized membrane protein YphA (DoxX/SURF4 family)